FAVQLRQLATRSVDQLAGSAGGARGEVPGLDQPHRESARHRVQRDPGPDDPAADDQDVEFTVLHLVERAGPLLRSHPCCRHPHASLPAGGSYSPRTTRLTLSFRTAGVTRRVQGVTVVRVLVA